MNNKKVKTRFAPSPTGLIHLGNVRTALFSLLYAKAQQGVFLLRIEDTDQERSQESYITQLIEDLSWLGIEWQEGPYRQSERSDVYAHYYKQLTEQDLAYPCYCSEAELAIARKIQLAAGKPPRYAGTCRHLSHSDRLKKEASGIKPTLRFKVPSGVLQFTDGVQGIKTFHGEDIGDFIIRRSDNSASFMFCNAIDDALMEVTHVIRGEDHLTNTPRQLWILEALGLPLPNYAHLPMIVGHDGKPLSKRNGSENISTLRTRGYFPVTLLNYLARLGHYYTEQRLFSLEELAIHFRMENVGHSSAHFDLEQLKFWQKTVVAQANETTLWKWMQEAVSSWVPSEQSDLFVKTVQPNVVFPEDALHWAQQLFQRHFDYTEHKELFLQLPQAFIESLTQAIQEGPFEYPIILAKIKERTGLVGKRLFMPLRVLLTGETAGPELQPVVQLLGKERILARLHQLEQQLALKRYRD